MAETGDLIQEFKNAKPPEKAVIIGGVLVVVGIAWYIHSKSQTGTTGTGDQSTMPQQSGWQTVGPNQTPVLPPSYCPQFDPSGNLVDFAPCGGSSTTTKPPGGTPPPKPPPKPTAKPGTGYLGPPTPFGPPPKPKPKSKPKPKPKPQSTHVATVAARQIHR